MKKQEFIKFLKENINEPLVIRTRINEYIGTKIHGDMCDMWQKEIDLVTPKPIDHQMPRYEVESPLIEPDVEKEWKGRKNLGANHPKTNG
jgi:hypothetical protein